MSEADRHEIAAFEFVTTQCESIARRDNKPMNARMIWDAAIEFYKSTEPKGIPQGTLDGYDAGAASGQGWVAVESLDDLPGDGRYLFALRKRDGGIRIAIYNVAEKPWHGVKCLAYMPIPTYQPQRQEGERK